MDIFKWFGIWNSIKGALDSLKEVGDTTERTARISYKRYVYALTIRIRKEPR